MTINHPHPKCENCIVRWKNCGLKPETCSKTYPISDKEIEFILQMNENLPTDEMELQVRDILVMDVRERTNYTNIADELHCNHECMCDFYISLNMCGYECPMNGHPKNPCEYDTRKSSTISSVSVSNASANFSVRHWRVSDNNEINKTV